MRNHVLRPLWVVLGAVALLLLVRYLMVPADFGVNGENFTYGFHRQSNIDEWQDVSVKYRGKEYCAECHEEKVEAGMISSHAAIQCENCHGPALEHPENPERLTIDTSRELCLRCHADLSYPNTERARIKAIAPAGHNPGMDCSACHNPHNPSLEDME
jgi:predicted CXXCH cytochrome family protein